MLACIIFLGEGSPGAEVDEVIRRAVEATNAAAESIPRAKGEGQYVYRIRRLIDGGYGPLAERTGSISFAFSGEKNWVKFMKCPRDNFDTTIYICDPETVMVGSFSEGIKPFGAEGHIRPSEDGGFSSMFNLPPHRFPRAYTYLDKDVFAKNCVVGLERSDNLHVVRFERERSIVKFYVDPEKDFHVVRHQRLEPDGTIIADVRKDWAKASGGLWYVREYCDELFPIRDRKTHTLWKFTFDSFEPNIHIPDDVFTVDALGLPVGARIVDKRFRPVEILRVKAPKTDMAALEKIIGELPKVIITSGPIAENPSHLRVWLVLVNVGAVLVVAGLAIWRVVNRKRRRS